MAIVTHFSFNGNLDNKEFGVGQLSGGNVVYQSIADGRQVVKTAIGSTITLDYEIYYDSNPLNFGFFVKIPAGKTLKLYYSPSEWSPYRELVLGASGSYFHANYENHPLTWNIYDEWVFVFLFREYVTSGAMGVCRLADNDIRDATAISGSIWLDDSSLGGFHAGSFCLVEDDANDNCLISNFAAVEDYHSGGYSSPENSDLNVIFNTYKHWYIPPPPSPVLLNGHDAKTLSKYGGVPLNRCKKINGRPVFGGNI